MKNADEKTDGRYSGLLFDPGFRPVRVAILVILAFVLTDAFLRLSVAHRFESAAFRLPADSNVLLNEYLAHLAKRRGPILYFIGDSTMQGQKLSAHQTIPADAADGLKKRGLTLSVANLGTTASKLPDFFYLSGRLRVRSGDIAVYNVNYKNFGEYDIGLPLRFKELYDPSLDDLAGPDAREMLAVPHDAQKSFSQKADSLIKAHWFLYRNRDLLNAAIFGLHPRKLIKGYYQEAASIGFSNTMSRVLRKFSPRPAQWTSTQWDDHDISILKRYYNVDTLDEDHPVFHFLRPAAQLASRKNIDSFFFANPMNRALCDRYGLVNWPLYESNRERIARAVEAGGGRFLDYTDLIPPDEFIDNDHLTAAGAQRLAARLVEDISGSIAKTAGKAAP